MLTAKGNLELDDAEALAGLLGTGETVEHRIGDHTFRRQSSTEFVLLDQLQWWAREMGA